MKPALSRTTKARFFILVPTEKDKRILQNAFMHIHDSDIDTDLVSVNQLAHQYLDDSTSIVVNRVLYAATKQLHHKKK